jgi:hypothetical protein
MGLEALSKASENAYARGLRPLAELYSPAEGATADPKVPVFVPLFLCIEEAITLYDTDEETLTDAKVSLALDRLSLSPEEAAPDPLIERIQAALRLTLTVNSYSRQQVRQAVRKIGKSVVRHENGQRGYLEFIRQFLEA